MLWSNRIEKCLVRNSTSYITDGFDYHKEYVENLTLSLIYGRQAQCQELDVDQTIGLISHLESVIEREKLFLTLNDGS